jgi:hypothetical protein
VAKSETFMPLSHVRIRKPNTGALFRGSSIPVCLPKEEPQLMFSLSSLRDHQLTIDFDLGYSYDTKRKKKTCIRQRCLVRRCVLTCPLLTTLRAASYVELPFFTSSNCNGASQELSPRNPATDCPCQVGLEPIASTQDATIPQLTIRSS